MARRPTQPEAPTATGARREPPPRPTPHKSTPQPAASAQANPSDRSADLPAHVAWNLEISWAGRRDLAGAHIRRFVAKLVWWLLVIALIIYLFGPQAAAAVIEVLRHLR